MLERACVRMATIALRGVNMTLFPWHMTASPMAMLVAIFGDPNARVVKPAPAARLLRPKMEG